MRVQVRGLWHAIARWIQTCDCEKDPVVGSSEQTLKCSTPEKIVCMYWYQLERENLPREHSKCVEDHESCQRGWRVSNCECSTISNVQLSFVKASNCSAEFERQSMTDMNGALEFLSTTPWGGRAHCGARYQASVSGLGWSWPHGEEELIAELVVRQASAVLDGPGLMGRKSSLRSSS